VEVEVVEVKSELKGNNILKHSAKVRVSIIKEKVVQEIIQETLEFLPEDVDFEEIEKFAWNVSDEFEQLFEKELIREVQEAEYQLKSFIKDEEYEVEIISEEELELEDGEKINIEEFRQIFEEEIEATIRGAFGNTIYKLAEKIAKKLLLLELKEEEMYKEVQEKEELVEESKREEEEPVEEFKRAIIVASKDFYITLPKTYLKFLYKKFGKVPKWVLFKYYKDGKIVIEPIWSEKEIEKEKLEWFGITKLD